MLVLIEGSGKYGDYARFFFEKMGMDYTDSIEDAGLVCFTGGADVTPSLYKQAKHPTTHNHEARDKYCMEMFNAALERNLPMVGICRGSQFLCVANKGTLWQDVDGHLGCHPALTKDGKTIIVTSTHHQEMNPVGGEILLTAQQGTYRSYMNSDGIKVTIPKSTPTVEAVYWSNTRSLGVQGHPEFGEKDFVSWFKQQVLNIL